ncbi:unnamed protein product [Alternaria alternata]
MTSPKDLEEQQQTLITPDQRQQASPAPQPTANTPSVMSRFSIPIDALTSRMNLGGRFDGLRNTSVSSRFANLRPISEFFDFKHLGSSRATTSQLYTTLFVIAIPLGLWASPFTTVLWLIGATGVTVVGHAAFMDKPIESAFSEEAQSRWFQELDSEDEKGGVELSQAFQPALNGKSINPDELYFNDMDIRAWERRTSALGEAAYRPDHQDGYLDDMGNNVNSAEHEEVLFRRVLDKIRIARAAGNTDVSLSPEELDAYHSRLYGPRSTAVRPEPQSRPSNTSSHDAASMISVDTTSKHGSSSRSKKNQQRSSIFGSKSKKEKSSSHKRTSTTDSRASPPGFVIPGPDGQPMYAPINAYQGNLDRENGSLLSPASRSASDTSHHTPPLSHASFSRDMLGAFPESEYDYRPATPPRQGRSISSRQAAYEADLPQGTRTRSSSIQSAGLVPFPVEPYQYHTFSPASSSSTASPQPQYTRRVSSGVSEASYTSVPRRVPVPAPASVTLQRAAPAGGQSCWPVGPSFVTFSIKFCYSSSSSGSYESQWRWTWRKTAEEW